MRGSAEFKDRVSISARSQRTPRQSAEILTVNEIRSSKFAAFYKLQLHDWNLRLRGARDTRSELRHLCDQALEFCQSRWAIQLVSLGWNETALFSANIAMPCQGGLVQTLDNRELLVVTEATAVLMDKGTGRRNRYHRFTADAGDLPLIWEACQS